MHDNVSRHDDRSSRRHQESSVGRDIDTRSAKRSVEEERHKRRKEDDPFWESKWEASEVQKKADEKVRCPLHIYLKLLLFFFSYLIIYFIIYLP
jgi:hypothetical protein